MKTPYTFTEANDLAKLATTLSPNGLSYSVRKLGADSFRVVEIGS